MKTGKTICKQILKLPHPMVANVLLTAVHQLAMDSKPIGVTLKDLVEIGPCILENGTIANTKLNLCQIFH